MVGKELVVENSNFKVHFSDIRDRRRHLGTWDSVFFGERGGLEYGAAS
jgi:hypothetical protein